MEDFAYIKNNLDAISAKARAARASSTFGQDVRILLATKYADAAEINFAKSCGYTLIGENRVQSLLEKYDLLDREGLQIWFIGSLQRNKVRQIIDKVEMIASLDSLPLAAEIEKQAARIGKVADCLVEINIGREEAKGGVYAEDAERFIAELAVCPHLRLCGLMTMAPRCACDADYRAYFAKCRALFDNLCARGAFATERPVLSMGMSESFVPAIAEGSNCVRVGRAAFARPASAEN
ncbi:MAG: YggS family pyridoxal phosphate-dependent enzyme [Clostridia bacterium]|nr:YggS family pyridoxal phosphate-dependent enzyme [Clostridia bacterium]